MNLRFMYRQLITIIAVTNLSLCAMQPKGLALVLHDRPRTELKKTFFSSDERDQREVQIFKKCSQKWADYKFNTRVFFANSLRRNLPNDAINYCLNLHDIGNINDFNKNADYFFPGPLHKATRTGDEPLVKKLLMAGANPNVHDHIGYTPLMRAAFECSSNMVLDLLKAGAKTTINSTSYPLKDTALLEAVQRINYLNNETFLKVTYLLSYGANPNVLNKGLQSPLSIALRYKKFDCVKALMQAKASKKLLIKGENGKEFTQDLENYLAQERLPIQHAEVIRLLTHPKNKGPLGEPLLSDIAIAQRIADYAYPDKQ